MIIGVTRTQYPYCKKNACVVWQPSWLKNPFSESSISLTSNYHKKVKTVPSYKRLSARSLPSQLFCCVSKNSSLAISFIWNELCCCFAKTNTALQCNISNGSEIYCHCRYIYLILLLYLSLNRITLNWSWGTLLTFWNTSYSPVLIKSPLT